MIMIINIVSCRCLCLLVLFDSVAFGRDLFILNAQQICSVLLNGTNADTHTHTHTHSSYNIIIAIVLPYAKNVESCSFTGCPDSLG